MVNLKKGVLIFLIVLALTVGICVPVGLEYFDVVDIKGLLGKGGTRPQLFSEEEYDDYQYLLATYGKLDSLRQFIEDYYYIEPDSKELDTWMYKGLFAGLDDPYSGYMTEGEYDTVMISTTGEYSGIGVTITAGESGYIEVVSPTDDTPAYRAGIKTGDYIVMIDGEEYYAEDLEVAAAIMRGEEGTDVDVTIYRDGEYIDLTLTREKIVSVSVRSEMLDDFVGYIRISSFMENTADEFRSALKTLESSGARAFVLDVRNNGGGLVDISVEVADCLMDKAMVVYAEDRNGTRIDYNTENGKTDLPFVLLINEGSASASEILACAIQDNGVAPVVGTTSFGKGIIQHLEPLIDGSAVKLTVMQYFSPSGKVIHKVGVTPDTVVELKDDCYDEEGNLIDDLQLKKAVEILSDK